MARIHNISSKLTLNTKNFTTRLDKARKRVRQFGQSMAKAAKRTAAIGAAAGAAAVGGLALLYRHHANSIDQTAKFARNINISTERLIGLRHAAGLAGVAQGKFDSSLERMTRRTALAAQGTGAAAGAIRRLGLDAQKLSQMDAGSQFTTIAERINGIDNASEQSAAAFQIFGREGQSLLDTLRQGEAGLAAAQEEAERLGKTFSIVDAAKVEAANDAISKVGDKIKGVGQRLTIALAPYVEAVAQKLIGMGGSGQDMGDMVIGAVEWVTKGIAKLADFLELGKAAFFGMQAGAAYALGGVVKAIGVVQNKINDVLEWIWDKLQPLIDYLPEGMANAVRSLGNGLNDMRRSMADAAEAAGAAMIEEGGERLQMATDAFERFQTGQNSQAAAQMFADIRASAEENARRIAEEAARIKNTPVIDPKVFDTLDDLDRQIDQFGLSEIEIKIAGLAELGALPEHLDAARQKMEKLAGLRAGAEVTKSIEEVEQRVRRFGLSEEENAILDAQANGANDEQIARLKAGFERLNALQAAEEARRAELEEDDRLSDRGPVSLTRVNSAESQRLAFAAARGAQQKDDTPRRQLDTQNRMASTLERIERNQAGTASEEGWEI